MQEGNALYWAIRAELHPDWAPYLDSSIMAARSNVYAQSAEGNGFTTTPAPPARSRRSNSASSGDSGGENPNIVNRSLRGFENNPMVDGISAPPGYVQRSVRDHIRNGSNRDIPPSDVVSFTRSDKYAAAYATRPATERTEAGTGFYAKGIIPPGSEYYDTSRDDHRNQAFPPKRKRGGPSKDPAVAFAKGAQEVPIKADANGKVIPAEYLIQLYQAKKISADEYHVIKDTPKEQLKKQYPNLYKIVKTRYQANETPTPIMINRYDGPIPTPNRVPGSTRPMTPTGEGSGSQSIRHTR